MTLTATSQGFQINDTLWLDGGRYVNPNGSISTIGVFLMFYLLAFTFECGYSTTCLDEGTCMNRWMALLPIMVFGSRRS